MDELYLALIERIKTAIPELQYVDEDYGQLEMQDESYPILFPCVLIENDGTQWKEISPLVQTGKAQLSFKLLVDCYDDTYLGSGQEDKIRERYALVKKLHKALQGFTINPSNMERMYRVRSQASTLEGGIKLYESFYQFEVIDESLIS